MVTIYDIAKMAGVSSATVSKVLNGYSDVSSKTVKKVRRICEEIGYRPNSVARGLATKKSQTIGIFFTDHLNSGFRHPFFQDILASFKEVVGGAGYDLIFFSDNSKNSQCNHFYDRARHRNVDGVFLMGVPRTDPNIQTLVQSNLPCIAIDLELVGPRCGYVTSDNVSGAIKAIDYLVEMGHTEIAFFSDAFSTKPGQDRLIGYRAGMQKHQIPINQEWILTAPFSTKGGYESCLRLLKCKRLPTAIFCANDAMALGVIQALGEKRIHFPEDMSIIGFDDLSILKYVKPGLTTIRQNKEIIGERAAKELLKIMQDPNYFPMTTSLIETDLVIRDSVKPPRTESSLKRQSTPNPPSGEEDWVFIRR